MTCKCGSERILNIRARAKDMHSYTIGGETYLEHYANVFSSDGDTTDITICLDCGQVQDTQFPMEKLWIEMTADEQNAFMARDN